MTKQSTFEKKDLYQEITDNLVALMEKGVNPWKRPWSSYGPARNYASGHVYTGINSLLLAHTGNPVPYFMTFKQANAMGGRIRKGAKSFGVYFYKTLLVPDGIDEKGKEQFRKIFYLKTFRVFNVADVEGIEFKFDEVVLQPHERIERCEAIVAGMPNPPEIKCEDTSRAYYSPVVDVVNVPEIGQFSSPEAYYSTLFHELGHSTGHRSRLNREGITNLVRKGGEEYSREELVAEMCAAFLCGQAGIDREDEQENTAAYLSAWVNVLKGDKKLVVSAAGQAQKAADYILGVNRYQNEEEGE